MASSNFFKPSQVPADQSPSRPTDVTVCCDDRWQVYYRLKELEISCQCGGFQPLTVNIQTATEALQLWSIVRRVSQSRHDLVMTLTKSWQLPCKYSDGQ